MPPGPVDHSVRRDRTPVVADQDGAVVGVIGPADVEQGAYVGAHADRRTDGRVVARQPRSHRPVAVGREFRAEVPPRVRCVGKAVHENGQGQRRVLYIAEGAWPGFCHRGRVLHLVSGT